MKVGKEGRVETGREGEDEIWSRIARAKAYDNDDKGERHICYPCPSAPSCKTRSSCPRCPSSSASCARACSPSARCGASAS
eukprot:8295447-Pyramimonas_sp.AAC.1